MKKIRLEPKIKKDKPWTAVATKGTFTHKGAKYALQGFNSNDERVIDTKIQGQLTMLPYGSKSIAVGGCVQVLNGSGRNNFRTLILAPSSN